MEGINQLINLGDFHPAEYNRAHTTVFHHQREMKFWHKGEKTEPGLCRHFLELFSLRINIPLTGLLLYTSISTHIMSSNTATQTAYNHLMSLYASVSTEQKAKGFT